GYTRRVSAAALALLPYLVVVADAPSPPARPRQTADNPCVEASAKGYAVHDRDGCKGITLTRVKSSLGAMRWNGDEKSVWVESLEVDWSLDLSMSVSKRYEEGGCAYKAVVAHETGHWNDSLDAQRAGLDGFEDDLVAAGRGELDEHRAGGGAVGLHDARAVHGDLAADHGGAAVDELGQLVARAVLGGGARQRQVAAAERAHGVRHLARALRDDLGLAARPGGQRLRRGGDGLHSRGAVGARGGGDGLRGGRGGAAAQPPAQRGGGRRGQGSEETPESHCGAVSGCRSICSEWRRPPS